MPIRVDEMIARLERFRSVDVPAYRAYRTVKNEIAATERKRLRIDELKARVMS